MANMRRWLPAACALLALGSAACGGSTKSSAPSSPSASQSPAGASQLRGLLPSPPPAKPEFALTDTSGRAWDMSRMTVGKLTYLYFGYTHCPDACPATMADIAVALRRQPAAVQSRVVVVFVTTDPRRDTAVRLRTWLNKFDASFVGLTGTPTQIAAAEAAAGVPLAKPEGAQTGNYAVAHSAQVFAYSPDGYAHVMYLQGNTAADYTNDLPLLLRA